MPFDASGVFRRVFNWKKDRDAGVNIMAERVDQEMNGFAQGLTDVVQGNVPFRAPVRAPNGTAGEPTFSFLGDNDTGLYRTGSGVAITVNGNKAFEVTEDNIVVNGRSFDEREQARNTQLNNAISQMESDQDTKLAQLDAWRDDARSRMRSTGVILFDHSLVHSKTSLSITPDTQDNSRSNWVSLADHAYGNGLVAPPGRGHPHSFAHLEQLQSYSAAPGYSETPEPYQADYSRTIMEYVVASYHATTEQINATLSADGLEPKSAFAWGVASISVFDVPVLNMPDLHPYNTLFVRYRNIPVLSDETRPAQLITDYGGDSPFVLHKLSIYRT